MSNNSIQAEEDGRNDYYKQSLINNGIDHMRSGIPEKTTVAPVQNNATSSPVPDNTRLTPVKSGSARVSHVQGTASADPVQGTALEGDSSFVGSSSRNVDSNASLFSSSVTPFTDLREPVEEQIDDAQWWLQKLEEKVLMYEQSSDAILADSLKIVIPPLVPPPNAVDEADINNFYALSADRVCDEPPQVEVEAIPFEDMVFRGQQE